MESTAISMCYHVVAVILNKSKFPPSQAMSCPSTRRHPVQEPEVGQDGSLREMTSVSQHKRRKTAKAAPPSLVESDVKDVVPVPKQMFDELKAQVEELKAKSAAPAPPTMTTSTTTTMPPPSATKGKDELAALSVQIQSLKDKLDPSKSEFASLAAELAILEGKIAVKSGVAAAATTTSTSSGMFPVCWRC
jgi:hypothetical protein